MPDLGPEQIAERLRNAIRRREIEPGTDLNQQHLAEELGVSRIPVREALRTLSSEGLVVMHPGRGTNVVELNSHDIADLYDLRLTLEPVLASEIIDSLSPADVRQLGGLAHAMDKTDDRDHWSALNYEFHKRMYEAVDRPHWIRIVLQVMGMVEPYSRMYVHLLEAAGRASHEHLQMIDALADGDAALLEQHITTHLVGAKEGLLQMDAEQAPTSSHPITRRRSGTDGTGPGDEST